MPTLTPKGKPAQDVPVFCILPSLRGVRSATRQSSLPWFEYPPQAGLLRYARNDGGFMLHSSHQHHIFAHAA